MKYAIFKHTKLSNHKKVSFFPKITHHYVWLFEPILHKKSEIFFTNRGLRIDNEGSAEDLPKNDKRMTEDEAEKGGSTEMVGSPFDVFYYNGTRTI